MEEIKLDLMDWKAIEKASETQIREAISLLRLGELTRAEAKKMIKSFKGGLTSEEERAKEKKDIEKNLTKVIPGT